MKKNQPQKFLNKREEKIVKDKLTKDYRDFLLKQLQDPEEAAAYINALLEDGDEAVLMLAFRDVVEAQGVGKIAKMSGLNRESLYRMLSKKGNPRLSSLTALLKALGLNLNVEVRRQTTTKSKKERIQMVTASSRG